MKPRLVNCPICGKAAPFDASNPSRPFCSERCKLIDLGQWATESYHVPTEEGPEAPENVGPGEKDSR